MNHDRLRPYRAECAVVGTAFVLPEFDVSELGLDPEEIEHAQLRALWRWTLQQHSTGDPVDLDVLVQHAGSSMERVFGDVAWIQQLGDHAVLPAQLPGFVRTIQQAAWLRRLDMVSREIRAGIESGVEPEEIQGHTEAQLQNSIGAASHATGEDLARQGRDRMERALSGDASALPWVPSGFSCFDGAYGGFPRGWPTVIGGRPKEGKTNVLVNFARRGAEKGIRQGVISLEMTSHQLAERMALAISGVTLQQVVKQPSLAASYAEGFDYLAKLAIVVDDKAKTVDQVANAARRLVRIEGCRTIYVDYVQLIRGSGKLEGTAKADDVADVLRNVAKDEQVALVYFAQFNRETDKRTSKKPSRSDFRGTDRYLMDAGLAFGVHRPWHHTPPRGMHGRLYTEDELSDMYQPLDLVCLAARSHGMSDLRFAFLAAWQTMLDVSEGQPIGATGQWPPDFA